MKNLIKQPFFTADGGGMVAGVSAAAPASTGSNAEGSSTPPQVSSQPSQETQKTNVAPISDNTPPATIDGGNSTSTSATKESDIVAGGLVLTIDPKTGRKVISTLPRKPQEENNAPTIAATNSQEQVTGMPNPNAIPSNITPTLGETNNPGLTAPIIGNQPSEYTANELLVAVNLNSVDESRVPAAYKEQYNSYKQQKAAQETARNQAPPAPLTEEQKAEQTKAKIQQNIQFYNKKRAIASEMARNDLGITQEDIDAAEYSDDVDLINRVNAYKDAVEFNVRKIDAEVQAEQLRQIQQAESAKAEHSAVQNDIRNFVQKVQKEEPNFEHIDKMLLTRYKELPYDKAKTIEPAIIALQSGNINRQQAIILEEYYNDTRKAFYAQASNVGTAPTPVSRPPAVEAPGTGKSVPQTTDFRAMRNMNRREKAAFLSNYYKNR